MEIFWVVAVQFLVCTHVKPYQGAVDCKHQTRYTARVHPVRYEIEDGNGQPEHESDERTYVQVPVNGLESATSNNATDDDRNTAPYVFRGGVRQGQVQRCGLEH